MFYRCARLCKCVTDTLFVSLNVNQYGVSDLRLPPARSFCLSTQITTNADGVKQARLDYLEEGRKVRQRIENERLKVENIKKAKQDSLVQIGIADKYQADLAKKRIL